MFKKLFIAGALLASANTVQANVLDSLEKSLLNAAASARHATYQCDKPRFDSVVYTKPGSPFFNVLFPSLQYSDHYAQKAKATMVKFTQTQQHLAQASGRKADKLRNKLRKLKKHLKHVQREERLYYSFARKVVAHQTSLIHGFKAVC